MKKGTRTIRYEYPRFGMMDGAPAHAIPRGACRSLINVMPDDRDGQFHGGKRESIIQVVSRSGATGCRGLLQGSAITGSSYPTFVYFGETAIRVGNIANALTTLTTGDQPPGNAAAFTYMPSAILRNDVDGIPAECYYVTDAAAAGSQTRRRFAMPTTSMTAASNNWTTRSGGGSFPISIGAMCAMWGKLVIAEGFGRSPSFYTSKQYDGRNFDFSSTLATGAFASPVGKAGQPGDNIWWLIPWTDERLVISCSKSLWMVNGDPKIGGRLLFMGDASVANNESWCVGADGRLWFMGPGGLHVIEGGGVRNVDAGRIKALRETNWGTTSSLLSFNAERRRLEIFIQPSASAGFAYFYLLDSDRFVRVEYPSQFRPSARVHGIGSSVSSVLGSPQNRPGYGCLNGFGDGIHSWAERAADTGLTDSITVTGSATEYAITGEIRFPPFVWPEGGRETICTCLRAYSPANCGPVSWYLITADTPDQCEATAIGSAVQSGTLWASGAGQNPELSIRAAGGAVQLVLRHTATNSDFRMGWIELEFEPGAPLRVAA